MNENIDDLTATVMDTLKQLTNDIPDNELDGKVRNLLRDYEGADRLRNHLSDIIENRTFTITGDTGHLSIKDILKQAENIDQPKEYDFQEDNVHEQKFLRSVMYIAPDILGFMTSIEEMEECIAGEKAITFKPRYDGRCYDCAKQIRMTLKGNHIHLDCASACDNNSEFSVEIDFPTGEVVFADWPDRFSEIVDAGFIDDGDDGESINYLKGQRQRSEVFERQGIFHQCVGNSSPSWWYNESTNQIQIGNGYDEETDKEIVPEGFGPMGHFCTDLWWVTMLDKSLYDELISKLEEPRSNKYYQKTLEVAKIKPGRYRFTSVPRDLDNDNYGATVYTKAEYIGPCTGTTKVKFVTDDKKILTPRQFMVKKANSCTKLYEGDYEELRFVQMDYLFNSIGNGIRSKGEFLKHISVPNGTELSEEIPAESSEPRPWPKSERSPYPNFQKQYSTFWEVPRDVFTLEWLEELKWFYNKCLEFFNSDKVGHYSGAFPSMGSNGYTVKSQEEAFNRHRKEGQTDAEWMASITKAWECEFDGDVEAFCHRNWGQKRVKIFAFIDETLKEIDKEIEARKVATKA